MAVPLIFKSTQPAPSTCPSLETYFKSTVLRHILSALWAIGMTIYLYAYQHLKFAGQPAASSTQLLHSFNASRNCLWCSAHGWGFGPKLKPPACECHCYCYCDCEPKSPRATWHGLSATGSPHLPRALCPFIMVPSNCQWTILPVFLRPLLLGF